MRVQDSKDDGLMRFASRMAGVRRIGCLRRTVVAELGVLVKARAWGIYELDENGVPTNVDCTTNVPDWFLEEYEQGGRPTDPILAGVVEQRGPVDSGRLLHWRRWRSEPVYEILDRVGFQRSLQAPVMVDGVVRGTLNAARHRDDPPFSATDLARMESVSWITSRVFERVNDDQSQLSAESVACVALDSVTEPVVVTEAYGAPLVVNTAAQAMVGSTKQELLPRCLVAIRENLAALRRSDSKSISTVVIVGGERLTVRTTWAAHDRGPLAVSRIYRRNVAVGAPPLDHSPLTPRQREIVAMVGAGMTVTQIAESAFVSSNTVKQHLKRIYGVLGVHSRAELVQVLWESSGSPVATGLRQGA